MTSLFAILDFGLIINIVLQVSLLCTFALLAVMLVGKTATRRYAITYSCLLATVLLSVFSVYLQSRDINLLAVTVEMPALENVPFEGFSSFSPDNSSAQFSVSPPPAAELDLPLAQVLTNGELRTTEIYPGILISGFFNVLILFWLFGIGFGWIRIALAAFRLRQLATRSNSLANNEFTKLRSALSKFPDQLRRTQVRSSGEINSPVQVGFIQSMVLLPEGFIDHSTKSQLWAVLLHELAHWQRRDNAANLLQKFIVALFWWHPLVLRLDRIASRAREEICDNYVLTEIDPVEYGETLLFVDSLIAESSNSSREHDAVLAVGIVDSFWSLENRIADLIDTERERNMKLSTGSAGSILFTVLGVTMLLAACTVTPLSQPAIAQDVQNQPAPAPRPEPEATPAMTLGPQVFEAIQEIQELFRPESENEEPDPEAAKAALDALYLAVFETANDFEKATILNFYTNYHLMQRDYAGAIERFESLLQIANLRSDQKQRTLRSLGQLYSQQERWQESIDSFEEWIEAGGEMDSVAAQGLSYAHYNLESWDAAREYWQSYLTQFIDGEPEREDLAYLNGLHYQLEDYEASLALTREMILQFNNQTDWDNLRVLQQQLEQMDSLAELDPDLGGTLDLGSPEPEIAFATVIPSDADYLPLIAVAPMYPRRAADDKVEGWVLVEFTVTPQGQVDENSIAVVDADPPLVFDRASIRAATEFVFEPRMVSGQAVMVSGVQYLFRFRLEDEDA